MTPIERQWQSFRDCAVPDAAPETVVRILKCAFFGGSGPPSNEFDGGPAMAMMTELMQQVDAPDASASEEVAFAMLDALHAELVAFSQAVRDGRA